MKADNHIQEDNPMVMMMMMMMVMMVMMVMMMMMMMMVMVMVMVMMMMMMMVVVVMMMMRMRMMMMMMMMMMADLLLAENMMSVVFPAPSLAWKRTRLDIESKSCSEFEISSVQMFERSECSNLLTRKR